MSSEKNILFVNACGRPESRTLVLAEHVLSKLTGNVEEVNLTREDIHPLTADMAEMRDEAIQNDDLTAPILRYARQFAAADIIVIAAPFWDLSFPSMLKVYMESVTVNGVTFYYTPEGIPSGLCKAQKLIYVTSAGGPIMDPHLGFGYISALAETFYHIPQIYFFKAENLDIVGADVPGILQEAKEEIDDSDFAEN